VKDRSKDRDSSYRTLVRDVILGAIAVICVSLAVPAWILRDEYRRTYSAPVKVVPAADVLRDAAFVRSATSETGIANPRPPDILELAERLVRREAERREAEKRDAERREAARLEAARVEAAQRAAVLSRPDEDSSAVTTPLADSPHSFEAP
jgi:hypothetical protein